MVPAAIMGISGARAVPSLSAIRPGPALPTKACWHCVGSFLTVCWRLNWDCSRASPASSLSNTVVYEVQTGASLIVQALLSISRDGFTLVALLVYLLYLNWQLTLIVAVVVPGVAWIMKTLSRRLYHLTKSGQQATDELAYVVGKTCSPTAWCACSGAQPAQAKRFDALSRRLPVVWRSSPPSPPRP